MYRWASSKWEHWFAEVLTFGPLARGVPYRHPPSGASDGASYLPATCPVVPVAAPLDFLGQVGLHVTCPITCPGVSEVSHWGK